MGYECSFTFFCANAEVARLHTGLGSLLVTAADCSQATLGDGTVVAFKSAWKAVRPVPALYALVPLSDVNIREHWFGLFEDGDDDRGSPAFDYAPRWHRGAPFEWFAVLASCQTMADREHAAITVRPCFKDLATIMSQDVVRRFYRGMAFTSGARLGLFVDDYCDILFSADTLVAREMHGSSFDESAPNRIDQFISKASHALELAHDW